MKKTKDDILKVALRLFTKYGVAKVSIRQIAIDSGISHSNLIYHYPTKNDLILQLHNQLFNEAIKLNGEVKEESNPIAALFKSTEIGFKFLFDYRFLMVDLNYILRENKALRKIFLEVEKVRAKMYHDAIQKAVEKNYLREENYEGEYANFIERIKLFSDFWISSAEIYDTDSNEKIIKKYTRLFIDMFYPYCTAKGRTVFKDYRLI